MFHSLTMLAAIGFQILTAMFLVLAWRNECRMHEIDQMLLNQISEYENEQT